MGEDEKSPKVTANRKTLFCRIHCWFQRLCCCSGNNIVFIILFAFVMQLSSLSETIIRPGSGDQNIEHSHRRNLYRKSTEKGCERAATWCLLCDTGLPYRCYFGGSLQLIGYCCPITSNCCKLRQVGQLALYPLITQIFAGPFSYSRSML